MTPQQLIEIARQKELEGQTALEIWINEQSTPDLAEMVFLLEADDPLRDSISITLTVRELDEHGLLDQEESPSDDWGGH